MVDLSAYIKSREERRSKDIGELFEMAVEERDLKLGHIAQVYYAGAQACISFYVGEPTINSDAVIISNYDGDSDGLFDYGLLMEPTIFRSHKGALGNYPLHVFTGFSQDNIFSGDDIPDSNPHQDIRKVIEELSASFPGYVPQGLFGIQESGTGGCLAFSDKDDDMSRVMILSKDLEEGGDKIGYFMVAHPLQEDFSQCTLASTEKGS